MSDLERRVSRLEVRMDELDVRQTTVETSTRELTWEARQQFTRAVLAVEDGLQRVVGQIDRLIGAWAENTKALAETNTRIGRVEDSIAGDTELREVRQEHADEDRLELNRRLAAIETRQLVRINVRRIAWGLAIAAALIAGGVWLW